MKESFLRNPNNNSEDDLDTDGFVDRRPSRDNRILNQGVGTSLPTSSVSITYGLDRRAKQY
jgi:hypothetical protein